MKPIILSTFVDKVDIVDVDTGEVREVSPDLVQCVSVSPYKTSLDGHSSGKGDGEVNKGEYLVDNTGYVDLETLFKRSMAQGVIPLKAYDAEFPSDAPLESFDPEPLPETPNIEGNGAVEIQPVETPVEPVGETSTM